MCLHRNVYEHMHVLGPAQAASLPVCMRMGSCTNNCVGLLLHRQQ